MATWISPVLPPLAFSNQAIMSERPVPPCGNLRWPILLPPSSHSETTCSCDPQSIPTNHLRSLSIMHSPVWRMAPVDRARKQFEPRRNPTSPLQVLTNKVGALVIAGCSWRIGSIQKDSADLGLRPRRGHASFRYAPLRVPTRRCLPKDRGAGHVHAGQRAGELVRHGRHRFHAPAGEVVVLDFVRRGLADVQQRSCSGVRVKMPVLPTGSTACAGKTSLDAVWRRDALRQ